MITGGSSSGKNVLLNLVNRQPDIDKIYLYAKDTFNPKYQILINKCDQIGTKHFNDPKAITKYSSDIKDIYPNIEDFNSGIKDKLLIVFVDMIPDMLSTTKVELY